MVFNGGLVKGGLFVLGKVGNPFVLVSELC